MYSPKRKKQRGGRVIDASSPVPRYFQLKEIILSQIRDRVLKAGDPLPPERILCETYGLARMTVRQATRLLVEEGYLTRRQGSGTYVSSSRVHYPLYRLRGFTEEMTARGFKTTSLLLDARPAGREILIRKKLGITLEEVLQKIVRVRKLQNEPFAIETNYIPKSRCPGLLKMDLENQSLYTIYEKIFQIHLKRAEWEIDAVLPTAMESRHLEIRKNRPALLMEGITYDMHDKPFEYVKGIYRNDRYKFTLEMAR